MKNKKMLYFDRRFFVVALKGEKVKKPFLKTSFMKVGEKTFIKFFKRVIKSKYWSTPDYS